MSGLDQSVRELSRRGDPRGASEVFDRAHFPTLWVEDGPTESDEVPLPLFVGMPEKR